MESGRIMREAEDTHPCPLGGAEQFAPGALTHVPQAELQHGHRLALADPIPHLGRRATRNAEAGRGEGKEEE